jgi:hypothetical protein
MKQGGVLEQWNIGSTLHYSNTPLLPAAVRENLTRTAFLGGVVTAIIKPDA